MPSHKQHNCLRLVKTIATFSFTPLTACDHCSAALSFCIIMAGHAKCSECTRCGCSCVSISLDFLNRAHLWLKSELKVAMNECVEQTERLFKLDVKVLHLFKTLKQNESCAVAKVCCVAFKLSNDNNGTENEENSSDSLNLDFLLKSMSSSFFIDSEPPSQTVVVFLHSWVGSLWALTCFLRYCILFIWQDSGFFR